MLIICKTCPFNYYVFVKLVDFKMPLLIFDKDTHGYKYVSQY